MSPAFAVVVTLCTSAPKCQPHVLHPDGAQCLLTDEAVLTLAEKLKSALAAKKKLYLSKGLQLKFHGPQTSDKAGNLHFFPPNNSLELKDHL